MTGCTSIPLTQGQVAVIDDKHADQAAFKWHAWRARHHKTFYARRNDRKPDGTRITVYLHQEIARRMGIVGNPDHIDRNGLNNRENNLRPDPHRLNGANCDRQANNTSGYKGVYWSKRRGKWMAYIQVCGKKRYLGYFDDPIEAAKAYDRAAAAAFGEFAVLNFPVRYRLIMETNSGPANDTSSDLALHVGEGIPLVLDEVEEPTVPLPYETNKQVSDGKLR